MCFESASIVGINQIFCNRTCPSQFTDSITSLKCIGAYYITNSNVSFWRSSKDCCSLDRLTCAMRVIDRIQGFFEEPISLAARFSIICFLWEFCTEKTTRFRLTLRFWFCLTLRFWFCFSLSFPTRFGLSFCLEFLFKFRTNFQTNINNFVRRFKLKIRR